MLAEPIREENILEFVVENSYNEAELVRSAQNGDGRGFKRLFDENVNRIYAFCLRMSANPQLAEEITQDVFVKAWENLHKFRGESKFSTWLHSIAINEFLTQKRIEKRFMQRYTTTDDVLKYDRHGEKPEVHFNTNIDIENAISSLPEQAKMVLILHDIEGYKHKEIAEMINIEVGTSKAHLHRARKILREELSK
jgi:RNA polymerase sigma-70 factor (ECF subfamily)